MKVCVCVRLCVYVRVWVWVNAASIADSITEQWRKHCSLFIDNEKNQAQDIEKAKLGEADWRATTQVCEISFEKAPKELHSLQIGGLCKSCMQGNY